MELLTIIFGLLLLLGVYQFTKKKKPNQLIIFRVSSSEVDSVLFGELWILRRAYWPEDTIEHYAKKVKKTKCTYVLFRDSTDGSIRGMYTETIVEGEIDGRKYRTLYLGNTFLYTYYRGSMMIAIAMLQSFATHWWTTPRGILAFVVFCAATYKPYLVAAHTFPNLYPTRDNHDSAKAKTYKKIISEVMPKIYPRYWDAEMFKLKLPVIALDLAPIKEEYLDDPDIKFFRQVNPNYIQGECMACIFSVSGISVVQTLFTVFLRTGLFAKKTGKSKKRDLAPIIQRDIARSWMHPKETKLSWTFNLSGKTRYKKKDDKKKLRKVIKYFGKSSDDLIAQMEESKTMDYIPPEESPYDNNNNIEKEEPPSDPFESTEEEGAN